MLKRIAAGLIDAAVVFIPVMIVIYLIGLEPKELLAGVLSGFCWFAYSFIAESKTGTTLGKKMLGLLVVSTDGPMTFSKAIIRNVPKMFWYLFLPIDAFVGLGVSKDPRQRWVDGVSATVVIRRSG